MKNYLSILSIIFVFFSSIFAQYTSIHQYENEFYNRNSSPVSNIKNLQYKTSSSLKLNKIVFGYLPYWEYYAGTHKNIRYDLLTHLAVFSYEADSLGNLIDPLGWPWNDVISMAKTNNVKLILTVTNFDGNSINKLITNSSSKLKFFSNLLQKVKAYDFHGVNIDFENVNKTDRNTVISNFFSELRNFFLQMSLNIEISFASPIVNWGGWDFSLISKHIDLFFIMGYDFYGSWSSTTGPSAPLIGGNFNITRSLSFDYYTVLLTNPEKLVLGVPYYGNFWRTKSPNPYVAGSGSKTKRYRQTISEYDGKEKIWDITTNTPWIRWQDTTWNQIWYDDEKSLGMKYDLAISKKIAGIGIWALGYDDGRTELWKLIENKFATVSSVQNEVIPTTMVLEQNYPNPFNPETNIRYSIKESNFVTLKVFDLLGREKATLVNEYKQAGSYYYKMRVDYGELTSGIYFYRLQSGGFSQTKKFVLLR